MTPEVEVCSFQECLIRRLCSTCHSVNLEHYRCNLGVDARRRYEDGDGNVDANNVDRYAAVDIETDGGAENHKDDGYGGEDPYNDLDNQRETLFSAMR